MPISRDLLVPFRSRNLQESVEFIQAYLEMDRTEGTIPVKVPALGGFKKGRKVPLTGTRYWRSPQDAEHSEWVEACLEARAGRLSDWEKEFCESVHEQLEEGRKLTAKQAEILERIYSKV